MDISATQASPAPTQPALPLRAIFGIAVFAILTILITWRAKVLEMALWRQSAEPPIINKQAPEFSLSSLDGREVSLADFRGRKKVVLSFWASWCGPCRLEMPTLKKFYEKHHTADSDFELLAVSIDEERSAAEAFATQEKLSFPVLLDSRQRVAEAYGVEGIPITLVIDQDGRVVHGQVGFSPAMEFELGSWLGIPLNDKAGGLADGNTGH